MRFPARAERSNGFHGGRNSSPSVVPVMARPLILVVRETPSLADSIQLLLETVGFRVIAESRPAAALSRLEAPSRDLIRAVVVACNEARSETLERLPREATLSGGELPLVVVGSRPLSTRSRWPPKVRSFPLPLEAGALVDHLMTLASAPAAQVASSADGPVRPYR